MMPNVAPSTAATLTVWLEHPGSPVRMSLVDPFLRRALMGPAVGLSAAALIYFAAPTAGALIAAERHPRRARH